MSYMYQMKSSEWIVLTSNMNAVRKLVDSDLGLSFDEDEWTFSQAKEAGKTVLEIDATTVMSAKDIARTQKFITQISPLLVEPGYLRLIPDTGEHFENKPIEFFAGPDEASTLEFKARTKAQAMLELLGDMELAGYPSAAGMVEVQAALNRMVEQQPRPDEASHDSPGSTS